MDLSFWTPIQAAASRAKEYHFYAIVSLTNAWSMNLLDRSLRLQELGHKGLPKILISKKGALSWSCRVSVIATQITWWEMEEFCWGTAMPAVAHACPSWALVRSHFLPSGFPRAPQSSCAVENLLPAWEACSLSLCLSARP